MEETDAAAVATDAVPVPAERREALTLLGSIFVVAAGGLVYELLIATVSAYLLGSSVTQFSIAIGVFIGSMGLGSHLSQRVRENLLSVFIAVEILLGVVGGLSVGLLFGAFAMGAVYWAVLYGALVSIGALTGLELPLLTRLLKDYGSLRSIIAKALSVDYVGALAGSVLFPLVLLPMMGMTRTAFAVGIVNVAVAAWNVRVFRRRLPHARRLFAGAGIAAVLLAAGFAFSLRIVDLIEEHLYEDQIIYTAQTPYQRIVVTRWRDDVRLHLDKNLQFSSMDEYRYHEALVHPALSLAAARESVLVLGGGDGLGVREVLKHPGVKQVTLIDIDPKMTELGKTFAPFTELNRGALSDPRVKIVNEDAHAYLDRTSELYHVILGDLPDPNTEALAKLYSREFYRLVKRHLAAGGVFATQATSPFYARDAYWCVVRSVEASGLRAWPYHAQVPSFGEWGFVLASSAALEPASAAIGVPTRYLSRELLPHLFSFGADVAAVPVEVSTFDRPTVQRYYLEGWRRWE